MFNRSFQTRSRRGDLVSAGEILDELVQRAADRQSFYRPAKRTAPGNTPHIVGTRKKADFRTSNGGKLQGVQLELPFHVEHSKAVASVVPDPERPLFDLIPEAYQ